MVTANGGLVTVSGGWWLWLSFWPGMKIRKLVFKNKKVSFSQMKGQFITAQPFVDSW